MADYDLTGLSTRSFEQLIQALAAKIIAPGIIVFGDGPDGGREATFEKRVPFPSSEDQWDGYCVVQAKFRQRPYGDNRDTEWLLKNLREELEKFADESRKLRRPEYYLLATNITLSSVANKGGKDKARRMFDEFNSTVPIKDFRVWDYDQLRAQLDGLQDIRHCFAAWITPGDVLSRVIEKLNADKPDFEETISTFLQKEFLIDEYANLEQAGHASEERTPLARVFVDLPASIEHKSRPPQDEYDEKILDPGIVTTIIEAGGEKLDPASSEDAGPGLATVDKPSAPENGRFVLVGGPGQGKTTVGQFIAQLYRAALLNNRPQATLLTDAKKALTDLQNQCEEEGIDSPRGRRFPIRIVLSRFASALSLAAGDPDRPTSLLSYISQQINKMTDREISAGDFRKWLTEYPWALILDGLDEVPASSNRSQVLREIQNFRVDAASANADLLIVATTRPQGYNDDFSTDTYEHWWLAPLSTTRAMHYANTNGDNY